MIIFSPSNKFGVIRKLKALKITTRNSTRTEIGDDELIQSILLVEEMERLNHLISSINSKFHPYQIRIYNISGSNFERGETFTNMHDATIINRSQVENSFNKLERKHDEETSKVLTKVAKFIEESKDPAAAALFNSFTEELNKPRPDKSRLKSFWSGIQNALPSIASISESVAKIVSLFA